MSHAKHCPDCSDSIVRRDFLRASAATTAALAYATLPKYARGEDTPRNTPETLVKQLYDTLSEKQRKDVCFGWDYVEPTADGKPGRGLLRTRVSNNWHITNPVINTDYFTKEQQKLVREIFEGIIAPEWHERVDRQLKDDAGGFGNQQNIAIFGKPGEDKFEFVMTGRHMTLRCDGNSAEHVAFGGPIFYGHQASRIGEPLNEKDGHPGNVYWPQALAANKVYEMLDGKQRKLAEVGSRNEEDIKFRGKDKLDGIPISELSADQKEQVQKTLGTLLEMYRKVDQEEVLSCLKAQGGLNACSLSFDINQDKGGDKVWDCWRLEGPAFEWYFRGEPHVHCWVNIASDSGVKTNV
jgi:hypothetical protein